MDMLVNGRLVRVSYTITALPPSPIKVVVSDSPFLPPQEDCGNLI